MEQYTKFLLVGIVLFLTTTVIAADNSTCGIINQTTTQINNITSNGSCITISGNNLIYSCSTYYIIGNNSGIGIHVNTSNNITINCSDHIINYSKNIYSNNSNTTLNTKPDISFYTRNSNITITLNQLTNTCSYGFRNARITSYSLVTCWFALEIEEDTDMYIESYYANNIPIEFIILYGAMGLGGLIYMYLRKGRIRT